MEHLYSPWRATYIKSFKSPSKRKSCLFCSIARSRKDSENLIVWRGQHCFVVLNRFPYNSGHVMIVPYRHTSKIEQLTGDEQAECFAVLPRCIAALKSLSNPHGFNFGANLGRVAGAGIANHIHYHLVPRWNGDTNFMPVLSDTKLVSEDLVKMQKQLSKLLDL